MGPTRQPRGTAGSTPLHSGRRRRRSPSQSPPLLRLWLPEPVSSMARRRETLARAALLPPPSSSPVRANGSVVHPWLPTRGVDCGGRTRSSCPQSPADDFETHSEARPLARMAAAAPMWWGKRVPFLLLNLQLVRLLNLVKFVEVFRGKYLFQYSASMNM